MDINYYGHSCFEIMISGKSVLIDPFISANPLASSIAMDTIKPDYILISHGHQDHMLDAFEIAKKNNALVIANYEITTWLNGKGLDSTYPMNIGGSTKVDFGSVKCVNAIHSSSFSDGTYAGNPMGFLIRGEDKTIYYAGDTAVHMDMQLLAEEDPYCAFLPIGDNYTMGVKDAVKAAGFVGCNKIIGMHYDTFPSIKIDHEAAKQSFAASGKQLVLMDIGSSINI